MADEQQKGGAAVVLRDRFQILSASPLPELSTPTAQAFVAEDRRNSGRSLFALIVRPGLPSRMNVMKAMKGLDCPGLMTLVEWGVVDWPPAGRKTMAVVYERPTGGRVAASLSEFRRLDEADAVRKYIQPIALALKELRTKGLTHRAIRPTNLFWATPERDRIVLGDCATAPPGLDQPVVFEPAESAMALPAGRGNGTPVDDVYAFGASLAVLLLGRNPVSHWDDDTVIRQKILQGSYAVLVGEERMPLAMVEILRGTLCDDGHERWTYDALDLWLSGRRLTPLLAKIEKRAARAFTFNDRDYFSARELAMAFARNWDLALPVVLDGKLDLWLRRSLDNKDKANAVALAVANAMAMPGPRSNDLLLAKICMILDPHAPIRYKGVSTMPDGLGWLLAVTMAEGKDVRPVAEILLREVTHAWVETRDAYNPDNSVLDAAYRGQKTFLEKTAIGYGPERVVYELVESTPCLSPLAAADYVLELRDLLPALNAAAKKADGKNLPMDRHIAAFIAARSNFDIDRHMTDLASTDSERSTLGMLNLLAVIQWRLGQAGLQGLAVWVGGALPPAINGFHSRTRRRELEKEIPRLVREGSLVDLARLLDSPEHRQIDTFGFDQARLEWAAAQREIQDIQAGRINNRDEAVQTARQLASLVSVTVSFITIVLLLLSKVF